MAKKNYQLTFKILPAEKDSFVSLVSNNTNVAVIKAYEQDNHLKEKMFVFVLKFADLMDVYNLGKNVAQNK